VVYSCEPTYQQLRPITGVIRVMQRPQPETVTLDDILITEELSRRSPHPPNLLSENQALHTLARQLVNQPEMMLQTLVDIALDLCCAGTAGVSLLEATPNGEEVFRWNVLAGALAQYVGGTTPRNFSPCGVCLERGTPVLFSHPDRYFTYFQATNTPIVEGLVLPLIADNHALGSIWIMSHDEQRHFDAEDVRVMTSLADFTAAALLLNQRQAQELLAKNAQLEAEAVERRRAEESARESEVYFRAIANLVPDMLWRNDTTGNSSWYNQRWLDYTGQTSEEAQGYGWLKAIHPDERPQSLANFQNPVDEGRPLRQEHRIRGIDGNYRWFLIRAEPVFDSDGHIIQWFGAATDIHEQRTALEQVRESEEKYRSLFESIGEGYALCEVTYNENERPVDVRYLEVNPAFEQLSGLENVAGKTVVELLPGIESFWIETCDRVAQTGVATRIEEYTESLNRWLDVYFSRVGGEGSRQIAVVFNDITERERTEEQLRRAAEMDAFRVKLSDALRSLTDSVQIQAEASRLLGEYLDVDRAYYVEVNEVESYARVNQDYLRGDSPSLVGVYRLVDYGWTLPFLQRGEAIIVADAQTSDIIPEADRETMVTVKIAAHISIPLVKAGALVGSLCVTEAVPREWSAAEVELVRETAERIWATIIRARAETELRESEIQRVREQSAREEERQRAENLAELDRAKTLFFSNISHEFRTPLTLLLAPLQDALSDCATAQPSDRTYPLALPHRERLELAHRNAMRLLKLVNTLLDFSRIEAGRMEAVYEPTDLAMFTTELASVFRSAIERAGLQLIVDCQPLPEPVYVDRQMWEKIVLNLLSNAFKFTFEGEITVRLHPADGDAGKRNGRAERVMLQIQDTGTGIAPEHLPHLFERFYQVRGSQARTHEGSGIGLALVHELIRLQGGTIDVSSTVGQGSCFTITLPLGTAHLPSVSVSEAVATLGASAGRDSAHRLRLDVGDSPSETLRDRITATRTLASTAVGAAPYVEEAERWLPQEGNREQGTGNREELSTPPDLDPPQPPLKRGENLLKVPLELSTPSDSDPPQPSSLKLRLKRGENLLKVPLFKGDLGGSPGLKTVPTPSSARVLLVDDNADMRDYLTRILSEHVQVEAVADGASVLAAANERVPDLVLTDVMMPGLDGFELLKALRANPRTTEVPIILLSARAGEESVVEGLEAGADDYLIKPFSAQQLVSRVNGHLQIAQLRLAALHEERTINRRKDELLSTVSHELNTPLVAILGWTRLLRANPSNQSMLMKSLETIERNATLQAKLIQDLLDITRISAGKLRLSLEPVELESVIEIAIASISHLAQAKQIDLVWWGVTGQQPGTIDQVLVQGDRDRLQQIIYNLLTNAIKFTPDQGSINVELSVIERHNGSDASIAEISITDTGIGISAEFLPHVFDRFRQAQESSSSKGLGLGLAIACHLVELHNGTIRAESAGVGQGATFVVRLPLMQQ
jgi:PAS domain S-box-containing protein